MRRAEAYAAHLVPGFGAIYRARRASTLAGPTFTRISDFSGKPMSDHIDVLSKAIPLYPHGTRLDLSKPEVMEVKTEDVELTKKDGFGQLITTSKDDILVRYGKRGIAASREKSPRDLLTDYLIIPKGSGVLDIEKHRPFLIETKDPSSSLVLTSCKLCKTPTYEENVRDFSVTKLISFSRQGAKIENLKIQQLILENRKSEQFHKETTLVSFYPTKRNRSSGTWMMFDALDPFTKADYDSTAMHFHPGERVLLIFTTDRPVTIKLNFCGVEESPDKRKDCEVEIELEKNALTALAMPAYTHHKFYGEFACMSVHPREGHNIIKAVESGTLPKGFIESATVFSKKEDEEEQWRLFEPEETITPSKPRSR